MGHQINAGIAQLVEHYLAKVDVRSSSLLTRSKHNNTATATEIVISYAVVLFSGS